MTHIFISYSQTDRAVAQALADDLTKAGQTVWWDAQLYAGQDFHDRILAALDACKGCHPRQRSQPEWAETPASGHGGSGARPTSPRARA